MIFALFSDKIVYSAVGAACDIPAPQCWVSCIMSNYAPIGRNYLRSSETLSSCGDQKATTLSTDTQDTEIIARRVFAEIAKQFPSLKMIENHDAPVEISITMPIQTGLSHQVWLCLQNYDELGFSAGHFYMEYFPCTKSDRVERYLDAVTGFLSGRYRIIEFYRGTRCYKAKLQKPEGEHWCTIAGWRTIWIPLSFKKEVKELRNQ